MSGIFRCVGELLEAAKNGCRQHAVRQNPGREARQIADDTAYSVRSPSISNWSMREGVESSRRRLAPNRPCTVKSITNGRERLVVVCGANACGATAISSGGFQALSSVTQKAASFDIEYLAGRVSAVHEVHVGHRDFIR